MCVRVCACVFVLMLNGGAGCLLVCTPPGGAVSSVRRPTDELRRREGDALHCSSRSVPPSLEKAEELRSCFRGSAPCAIATTASCEPVIVTPVVVVVFVFVVVVVVVVVVANATGTSTTRVRTVRTLVVLSLPIQRCWRTCGHRDRRTDARWGRSKEKNRTTAKKANQTQQHCRHRVVGAASSKATKRRLARSSRATRRRFSTAAVAAAGSSAVLAALNAC